MLLKILQGIRTILTHFLSTVLTCNYNNASKFTRRVFMKIKLLNMAKINDGRAPARAVVPVRYAHLSSLHGAFRAPKE